MFNEKYNRESSKNPYGRLPVGHQGYRSPSSVSNIHYNLAMLERGEQELLADIPRILGPGNYLNLGEAKGGSAILLAQGLKYNALNGSVHTVDLFTDNDLPDHKKYRSIFNHTVQSRIRYLDNGVDDYIVQYVGSTDHWVDYFEKSGRKFRFIFIDADHTYEGVKRDWLHYSKFVDPDGLVAFHDTNQDYTDRVIRKYVSWNRVAWVNRIKIFKRNLYARREI